MKILSLADFLQLYIMPQLSDVLKNKSHEETPLEKQQRLQIEAEIADRARQEEEAALEADSEYDQSVVDALRCGDGRWVDHTGDDADALPRRAARLAAG